jgi:hypothetical protein
VRQLVGQRCTLCQQRISTDLDGRFCRACGCPVHTDCVPAAGATPGGDGCPSCHTPAAVLRELAGQRRAVLDELPPDRKPTPGAAARAGGACPKCGLVNPPSAQRCDCGYDFVTGTVEQSYVSARAGGRPDTGSRVVGYGCLALAPLALLGGLVAVMTPRAAGGGAAGAGYMIGAFTPGALCVLAALYLLRRGR